MSWKRGLSVYTSYNLGKSENNTEGAFAIPASGSLATEWGPSGSDTRHRFYIALYSAALKNLTVNFGVTASSGAPYTILTGHDDNLDSVINDRPAGVGRNTVRAAGQWNSNGYFTYAIGIGKRSTPLPPGIMITGGGMGGYSIGSYNQTDAPKYRLAFTVSAQNLTNHENWVGYSGLMTSPFFLQPTNVEVVRTVNLSVAFSF